MSHAVKRARVCAWTGSQRVRVNVSGTLFETTAQTLVALGRSFFDGALELEEEGDIFLPYEPAAFTVVMSALILAREGDLASALLRLRDGASREVGANLRVLLRFLLLGWAVGIEVPLPDTVRRIPFREGVVAPPSPASPPIAICCHRAPHAPAGIAPFKHEVERRFAESFRCEGVLSLLRRASGKRPPLPDRFDMYDVEEPQPVLSSPQACRPCWGLDVAFVAKELNAFSSRYLLRHVPEELKKGRTRVAMIVACALMPRPLRSRVIPNRCHWRGAITLPFASLQDDCIQRREPQSPLQSAAGSPTDTDDEDHDFGLENIGLRRMIFDLGPAWLLHLQGIIFIMSIPGQQEWTSAKLCIETLSDHFETSHAVEMVVKLHPGRTVAWQLGVDGELDGLPLGRMFAVSLEPEELTAEGNFQWELRAAEFFGHIWELPETLLPEIPRPTFKFDERSERDYVNMM